MLNLMLEDRLILEAIIARRAAHHPVALPVIEDAGDVLACNAGHGGKVVLRDFLTNDDPPRSDFLPEMVRQLEQCLGNPTFEREEARGCHHLVSLTHAFKEKPKQRLTELAMLFPKGLEHSATEKAQCGIAHRHHRRRTRQPINNRKLTDDVASAEKSKNALGAGARNHRNLEESVLDAITAVAWIAGPEQHPTGGKLDLLGVGE
jgi:hypothetical protein